MLNGHCETVAVALGEELIRRLSAEAPAPAAAAADDSADRLATLTAAYTSIAARLKEGTVADQIEVLFGPRKRAAGRSERWRMWEELMGDGTIPGWSGSDFLLQMTAGGSPSLPAWLAAAIAASASPVVTPVFAVPLYVMNCESYPVTWAALLLSCADL